MTNHHASAARAYGAFAAAAGRYWASAWPLASREIRRWQRHAVAIPDPHLRAAALANLSAERGNLEGAAAFAVLAGRPHRRPLVASLVAFQVIYDYVDTLVEHRRHADPAISRRLHQALRDAVTITTPPTGGYDAGDDGGYLEALVDVCRVSIAQLPGSAIVAPLAEVATARMVDYQVRNHDPDDPDRTRLAAWSAAATPAGCDLAWWEHAAAAASSLAVFALLALAAEDEQTTAAAVAITDAYLPIGALHVLLDSLVDRDVDGATGDHSLIAHYDSTAETIARLTAIAHQAALAARTLPASETHGAICAAMAAYYLSKIQQPDIAVLAIAEPLGAGVRPAVLVLRSRRRIG